MARARRVLPAPGEPTRSMLWTKDRTLFHRYCKAELNNLGQLKTHFFSIWAIFRFVPRFSAELTRYRRQERVVPVPIILAYGNKELSLLRSSTRWMVAAE